MFKAFTSKAGILFGVFFLTLGVLILVGALMLTDRDAPTELVALVTLGIGGLLGAYKGNDSPPVA